MQDLQQQLTGLPIASPYQRLVVQFRYGQLKATLAWLDTCAHTLVVVPT